MTSIQNNPAVAAQLLADQVTQSGSIAAPPAPPPSSQNQVFNGQNGTGQSSAAGAPADGAREATEPAKAGWRSVNEEVEERLNADPEYAELKAKYETHKGMANDFAIVDQACWFGPGDGLLGLADIQSVANDPAQTPEARAAAQRLLQDMAVFNEAAAGNQQLTSSEVMTFLKNLKGELSARKAAMTEKVEGEHAKKAEQSSGSAASGQTGQAGRAGGNGQAGATAEGKDAATQEVIAQIDQSNPKPAPSEFSGLEGATENMNNMIGWGESEIDRLTELMGKTDDPATLKKLENKINQMTRRMQQMTALMNQLATAMQNISKMYSDIAMNAVRNMR